MDENPRNNANSAVISVGFAVLIAFLLATYVAGYFMACEGVTRIRVLGTDEKYFVRDYHAEWISAVYRPMAYVESILTQKEVRTGVST